MGFVRSATPLSAMIPSTLVACVRRCWNGTAIVAACDAPGRGKWEIIVHHRAKGRSALNLMISLCPGCHAKVHRTRAVLSAMPPLLLELWREQHPKGHEQTTLNFNARTPPARTAPLFEDDQAEKA